MRRWKIAACGEASRDGLEEILPSEATGEEIVYVIGALSPQIHEEVAAVAAVLQSWGYPMRVIAPMTRAFRQDLAAAGIPVREIDEPSGESLPSRWSDARGIASVLRQRPPMLLHAHGFQATVAALLSQRGTSGHVPVVTSPHLLPHLLRESPGFGLRSRAYRWALARSHSVVLPTETQREELAEFDETAAEAAEMVPYALPGHRQPPSLDLGRRRKLLGITPPAVVVGCVVDDLHREGIEGFLDAAAELCMEYPSLEFALIGRDVDNPANHELTHARGLLGAAVFVDPHDRFHQAISSLNVLVTPQAGWPSGMLALQALAADVGVVAIEGGEVEEIAGLSPHVTIVPANGEISLGEGIIRQLRAASQRMMPEQDAPESHPASEMLVSRAFFDLDEAWTTPSRDRGEASRQPAGPDLAASFDPTRSARALIAVYQRLLEEADAAAEI